MSSASLMSRFAQGQDKQIEGVLVYSTQTPTPAASDKVILFLHDSYGWRDQDNRNLADYYAEELNVKVLLPDFMTTTKNIPPAEVENFTPMKYLEANSRAVKWPQVFEFVKALKEKHSYNTIAAVGFSWGGMWSVQLAATDLVVGSVLAHPPVSLIFPDDLEKISKPFLLLCAENEPTFVVEKRQQTEAIFAKKQPLFGKIIVYPATPKKNQQQLPPKKK